ncbi:MAG: MerR family DNA-binding protein [Janthinobacterium lividum]
MGQSGTSGAAPLNIGQAAERSGVSARMLRHCEGLGLPSGVARTEGGYRQYTEADIHSLRFIKRSRDLGFSMDEITELLGLWQNRRRASSSVKRIAAKHPAELEQRIAGMQAMQAMQRTLSQGVHRCHGDARPDCRILEDLAGIRPAP